MGGDSQGGCSQANRACAFSALTHGDGIRERTPLHQLAPHHDHKGIIHSIVMRKSRLMEAKDNLLAQGHTDKSWQS